MNKYINSIFIINIRKDKQMIIIYQYIFQQDMILHFALTILLFYHSLSTKIFLIGGNLADNTTTVLQQIAYSTSKSPRPYQCNQDWMTTFCPKIAVVTSGSPTQADGNNSYSVDTSSLMSYKHLFVRYGLSPNHVSVHIDNYKTTIDPTDPRGKSNYQIIQQADIIFFNGGAQSRHSRCWLTDNGSPNDLMKIIISKAVDNKIVLVGTSAGTMVMPDIIFGQGSTFGQIYFNSIGLAPKMVNDGAVNGTGLFDTRNGTQSLQYRQNGGKMPGFNLFPYFVDTHFSQRGRLGRIIPALIDVNKTIAVAIDENTCFYYNNGIGKVLGQNAVYIVNLTEAQDIQRYPYLKISNVMIDYLTEGDTYDLGSGIMKSNKQKIRVTNYNGTLTSNNIFFSKETSLLIQRLVDQHETSNFGFSKTPSSFDSVRAPVFIFNFTKSWWDTQGYKSKNSYSAKHVYLSISYII